VLDWFDEVGSKIVVEFLERWPSLEGESTGKPRQLTDLIA